MTSGSTLQVTIINTACVHECCKVSDPFLRWPCCSPFLLTAAGLGTPPPAHSFSPVPGYQARTTCDRGPWFRVIIPILDSSQGGFQAVRGCLRFSVPRNGGIVTPRLYSGGPDLGASPNSDAINAQVHQTRTRTDSQPCVVRVYFRADWRRTGTGAWPSENCGCAGSGSSQFHELSFLP